MQALRVSVLVTVLVLSHALAGTDAQAHASAPRKLAPFVGVTPGLAAVGSSVSGTTGRRLSGVKKLLQVAGTGIASTPVTATLPTVTSTGGKRSTLQVAGTAPLGGTSTVAAPATNLPTLTNGRRRWLQQYVGVTYALSNTLSAVVPSGRRREARSLRGQAM